jgi:hypothetical protein
MDSVRQPVLSLLRRGQALAAGGIPAQARVAGDRPGRNIRLKWNLNLGNKHAQTESQRQPKEVATRAIIPWLDMGKISISSLRQNQGAQEIVK